MNLISKIISIKSTFVLIVGVVYFTGIALGQTNNVGIGTTMPDSSAKLEVFATDKGILIPRITESQRNAIANPATGLLVFQTDQGPGFRFWDGAAWTGLTDNLGNHIATQALDMASFQINNVAAPVSNNDAVNKAYVDAAVGAVSGGGNLDGYFIPSELSSESAILATGLADAAMYCDSLTEGGNTDWVLPSFSQYMYCLTGGTAVPGPRSTNFMWTVSHRNANNEIILVQASDLNWIDNSPGITTYTCRCVR